MRIPFVIVLGVFVAGCGGNSSSPQPPTGGGGAAAGNKKGMIILYRDQSGVCKTSTTPFIKLKPQKIEWRIDDDFDCNTSGKDITLEFPTGDLSACNGQKGTTKIECDLSGLTKAVAATKYTVVFESEKEDPVLEIENP